MRSRFQGRKSRSANARTDVPLADRFMSGDGEAFKKLYGEHVQHVYNLCNKLCKNPQDAADATQETFYSVAKCLQTTPVENLNFIGYLLISARNECIKINRRHDKSNLVSDMPETAFDLDSRDIHQAPERSLLLGDQRKLVRRAYRKLTKRHRRALSMRELEGMSYAQIGTALSLSENAVAQLIKRARTKLKQEIIEIVPTNLPESEECIKARPLFSKQLNGVLGEAEVESLQSHLDICKGCKSHLTILEEIGMTYRSFIPATPAVFAQKVPGKELLTTILNGWRSAVANVSQATQGWQTTGEGIRESIVTLGAGTAIMLASITGGVDSTPENNGPDDMAAFPVRLIQKEETSATAPSGPGPARNPKNKRGAPVVPIADDTQLLKNEPSAIKHEANKTDRRLSKAAKKTKKVSQTSDSAPSISAEAGPASPQTYTAYCDGRPYEIPTYTARYQYCKQQLTQDPARGSETDRGQIPPLYLPPGFPSEEVGDPSAGVDPSLELVLCDGIRYEIPRQSSRLEQCVRSLQQDPSPTGIR